MLFTRCPDCRTTYRLTSALLEKADGQVRCGRCHAVFDAYVDLSEDLGAPAVLGDVSSGGGRPTPDMAVDDDPLARTDSYPAIAEDHAPSTEPETDQAAHSPYNAPVDPAPSPIAGDPTTNFESPDTAAALTPVATAEAPDWLEEMSLLDLIEDIEMSSAAADKESSVLAGVDDAAPTDRDEEPTPAIAEALALDPAAPAAEEHDDELDHAVMSAEEVAAVLERENADFVTSPALEAPWTAPTPPKNRKLWVAVCLLAAATLALQVVNHFRETLLQQPYVGSLLSHAYAELGIPLEQAIDLDAYEILEWTATAETDSAQRNLLRIVARVRNVADSAHPYPDIRLKLTDRWESTVGTRIFSPDEYLQPDQRPDTIPAGMTVAALLAVVDPGPDAYGFELDICAPADAAGRRCANDQVFR